MSGIFRRLGWMVGRGGKDAELEEEIRFHLEEEARQAAAGGLTAEQARWTARRELGNVALVMEDARAAWGWMPLERLWRDARYALWMLRRNPGFAAAAVLSLALGIGANTAIFSLLNAVVLRTLPVAEPGQLVQFTNTIPLWETGSAYAHNLFGYPQLAHLEAHRTTLSGIIGGTGIGRLSVDFQGRAALADGDACTGNFFAVLGIAPQYGRLFSAGDDRADAAVVVLADSYWRSRFGADPAIVGGAVTIDRMPFTVVGIAPRDFAGLSVGSGPDIWVPLHALDRLQPDPKRWTEPFASWMWMAGRLRPGVARERAQAEVDVLRRQFLTEQRAVSEIGGLPNVRRFVLDGHLALRPAGTGMASGLRERYAFPLQLLMWVAGTVLLIACANLANLLLARASQRRREIAVRMAIGASRGRLVRQLLTESMALAALGGALAVPLAWWGGALMVHMISGGEAALPVSIAPDLRVLAFAAAISLLTGILFGLAPALRATGVDPAPAMKEGTHRAGLSSRAPDRVLVVAQVALSVVLISGAGLFVRTLHNLWTVDMGYERENVLLFSVDAKLAGYRPDGVGEVYREILDKLRRLPGVQSASASVVRPEDDEFRLEDRLDQVDGRTLREPDAIHVAWNSTSPGYFSTVMTPLVAGRDFEARDREKAPRVVIVNQSLARRAFPNGNPLGHQLGEATVIGVVKDARNAGAREGPAPVLYYPLFQHGPEQEYRWGFASFELRYGARANLLDEARRAVASVDPNLPVFRAWTLVEQAEQALLKERLLARLSSFFGALAVVLACVGLYGLMACAVERRGSEIGIRLALGARPGHIMRLVLGETVSLTVAGIAAGVPLALWAAHYAKSVLFGIGPADPWAIAGAAAILTGVAAVAAYVPARRALSIDPAVAVRCE
jgi:predicted permease